MHVCVFAGKGASGRKGEGTGQGSVWYRPCPPSHHCLLQWQLCTISRPAGQFLLSCILSAIVFRSSFWYLLSLYFYLQFTTIMQTNFYFFPRTIFISNCTTDLLTNVLFPFSLSYSFIADCPHLCACTYSHPFLSTFITLHTFSCVSFFYLFSASLVSSHPILPLPSLFPHPSFFSHLPTLLSPMALSFPQPFLSFLFFPS